MSDTAKTLDALESAMGCVMMPVQVAKAIDAHVRAVVREEGEAQRRKAMARLRGES